MHVRSAEELLSSLKLSERLEAIAGLVERGTSMVADIGTDHAYLPIWLVGNNICHQAVASDLRSAPAERARQNVEKYGLADRIKIKTGDGLSNIGLESDILIIIAGMGGLEIERILNSARLPKNIRLILQPQKSVPELRTWLDKNGFRITEEKIVIDRKHFYTVIKTEFIADFSDIKNNLSLTDLWIGPGLISQYSKNKIDSNNAEIWYKYLKYLKNKVNKMSIGRPELREVIDKISEYQQSNNIHIC